MQTVKTATSLHRLGYSERKTYLMAALFVTGNILLPQLCHLIPQGGLIFLPIYFFTLFGAYKYGRAVGLLTAVASPLVNNLMFGMPASPMLPVILTKSILLALAASFVAGRFGKATLPLLALAVAAYQAAGSLAEWALTGSLQAALQDVRLGLPGILLQIFGVWALLRLTGDHAAD